jgi:hypothetical protein
MAAPTIYDLDTLTGPRATASAHRKVELQAPADLAYLIANVSRAAHAKIDTHLPPDAAPESGEDALRRRVEALVEEYIRKTFEGAKEGMEINGMGAGEMEEVLKRVGEGEGEFLELLWSLGLWFLVPRNGLADAVLDEQKSSLSMRSSRSVYSRCPHRLRTRRCSLRVCDAMRLVPRRGNSKRSSRGGARRMRLA